MNSLLLKGAALSRSVLFKSLAFQFATAAATGSKEHIDSLVKNKKIVVFMKGTKDAPQCGFSNAVVQILKFHGISDFDTHNVLADENLRQGKKLQI